ncbi:unnamed protein product [Linum trigynum]|uniref:Uncharacterized protein n=1 Tax=Linum trigynum TaxID=586398 RepID=A0AAV2ETJ9_9ROSI
MAIDGEYNTAVGGDGNGLEQILVSGRRCRIWQILKKLEYCCNHRWGRRRSALSSPRDRRQASPPPLLIVVRFGWARI